MLELSPFDLAKTCFLNPTVWGALFFPALFRSSMMVTKQTVPFGIRNYLPNINKSSDLLPEIKLISIYDLLFIVIINQS